MNDSQDKNRQKAIDLALASIEKEYGKGSIMRLKDGTQMNEDVSVIPTGSIGLDIALGIGGFPKGRIVEVYGPESSGKTTLTLHAIAQRAEGRRRRGVHRRRARARPRLRTQARREDGRAARLAARLRRAGARDRRHARPLERGRHHRRRLGRGARAEGRNRRRHGRQPRRPPGPPHEPGAPQAHGHGRALELPARVHQPDPHEDRRHVRLARDDDRRQCAQVLRVDAPRHPPHRRDQRSGDQRQEGPGRRSATARA